MRGGEPGDGYLPFFAAFHIQDLKKNTVVPRYLSLISSGLVALMTSANPPVPKTTSTEQWRIFSCGLVLWLIQLLASAMCPEQALRVETFFSHQNAMSTGFDEYWSWRVLRYDCTLLIMLLQLSQFPPFAPSTQPASHSQSIPTQLSMSVGHSYMVFN